MIIITYIISWNLCCIFFSGKSSKPMTLEEKRKQYLQEKEKEKQMKLLEIEMEKVKKMREKEEEKARKKDERERVKYFSINSDFNKNLMIILDDCYFFLTKNNFLISNYFCF